MGHIVTPQYVRFLWILQSATRWFSHWFGREMGQKRLHELNGRGKFCLRCSICISVHSADADVPITDGPGKTWSWRITLMVLIRYSVSMLCLPSGRHLTAFLIAAVSSPVFVGRFTQHPLPFTKNRLRVRRSRRQPVEYPFESFHHNQSPPLLNGPVTCENSS